MDFDAYLDVLFAAQGVTPEERALLEEDVISAERVGPDGAGANETWHLEVGPSHEGAYFKPVNGVNRTLAYLFGHTRQSVLLAEVAAYRLAHALGAPYVDLVPACVLRLVPEVDPDAPGSLTGERFDDRSGNLFECEPALALHAAFFDAVIGNQDRSRANLLFDPPRSDLALIDHGFAFPRDGDIVNDSILTGWRRRAGLDALTDRERERVALLLEDPELLGMRRCLEPERVEAFERRARYMRDECRLA